MKLLTHNMLECNIKGVKNKYPFKVEAEKVDVCECEFNPDFLRSMYAKLDWTAFRETALSVSIRE